MAAFASWLNYDFCWWMVYFWFIINQKDKSLTYLFTFCFSLISGRFGQVHKCMENSSGLTLAAKIIKARSQKEKVREKIVGQCGWKRRRKGSFYSCHFCEIGNIAATMQWNRTEFRRGESCAAMTWQWMRGWQLTHVFIVLNYLKKPTWLWMRWWGCVAYWWRTVNPIDNPGHDRAQLSKYSPSVKWSCEIFRKLKAKPCTSSSYRLCEPHSHDQRCPSGCPSTTHLHIIDTASARIRACDVGRPKMYCHMSQMPAVADLKPWPHAFISVHQCFCCYKKSEIFEWIHRSFFYKHLSSCWCLFQLSSAEDGLHTTQENQPGHNHSHSVHFIPFIHSFSLHWIDHFANVTITSYKLNRIDEAM